MRIATLKTSRIVFLIAVLFGLSGCGTPPTSLSQITPVPSGVDVMKITETDTVNGEITQIKTFNQCDSASPFKAQVQFSSSSSQSTQQELVLKGSVTGEAGISALAKVKIEGAIEQHFASSSTSGQDHQETVALEVPAHSQQEYTIVWRETRREGSIQYQENGETKSVDFSYRIGLELTSASGRDLACPGQPPIPAEVTPSPTNVPTLVQQPIPATDNSQQDQCQWLQINFPQSADTARAEYHLPTDTTFQFIYELCPSTANAFAFKAKTTVEIQVPVGGCVDSWAGFT